MRVYSRVPVVALVTLAAPPANFLLPLRGARTRRACSLLLLTAYCLLLTAYCLLPPPPPPHSGTRPASARARLRPSLRARALRSRCRRLPCRAWACDGRNRTSPYPRRRP